MKMWWNPVEAQDWLATLADTPLTKLMSQAEIATISGHGTVVTYSRKVFIPLTKLCRDVCHYCTFAHRPSQLAAPYLDLDEVLAIARAGEAAGLGGGRPASGPAVRGSATRWCRLRHQ